jgi:predicted short-subunit dehydrogenase-like oxidoreductase (DUF2520 family)
MPKNYKISFIGSGNLATRLAPEFENAGHQIMEVCSRNDKNALVLTSKLYNADIKTDYDFTDSKAEIIIIAVKDDVIADIAKELVVKEDVIIAHTSGSKPLDVLNYTATENTGVFYPLQTFSKDKRVNFENVPIFVEAFSIHAFLILNDLARSISKKVFQIDSEKRMAVHVSAVFACNFTNYLFRIAQEIMNKENLPFDLLKPLIVETINKSLALGPEKSQTGPAYREDLEILDRHMDYLSHNDVYKEIYRIVSQDIIDKKNR